MSIEHVRLSEKGKQQLITLKRRTGIENWNVLCRWAFCLSITESSVPPHEEIPTDSSVEMSWKTFGGDYAEIYLSLLKLRAYHDYGSDLDNNLYYCFKLHLHRGISYLLNKTTSIDSFVEMAKSR